jgi:hypothetical protein
MSLEQHLANSTVLKGTYAWKDPTTASFTDVTPPPKSPDRATTCFNAQDEHKLGDTWTMNESDGKPATR